MNLAAKSLAVNLWSRSWQGGWHANLCTEPALAFGDLVIGVVGALIASLLYPWLGLRFGSGIVASIISPTLGAMILLVLVRLVRGHGRW